MALETLKNVKEINGFNIINMTHLRNEKPEMFNESGAMDYKVFEKEIRPHNFIYIRDDVNSISFTLQNGPIKEVGVNGCQVTEMIWVALEIIKGLNEKFPCRENAITITKLEEALMWQDKRSKDREARGVEGLSKE